MGNLRLALCAIVALSSCRQKNFYGVGFKSCTDELIRMSVRSATYSTQLAVPLRKGQIKSEEGITVPLPSSVDVTWSVEGQPSKSAKYQITGRLPRDFDVSRDTLWFVACENAAPLLLGEVRAKDGGPALERLSDGQRWMGKSIYQACDVCSNRTNP